MWNRRHSDLWLWPMPEWFVRGCNRIGGTLVLDAIFILALGGLVCAALSFCWPWLRSLAYVLLSPVGLLLAMMIITAQVRRLCANTPEARRRAAEEEARGCRDWQELLAKVALLRTGERAYCAECGGELRLEMRPADDSILEYVRCDKGCTNAYVRVCRPE